MMYDCDDALAFLNRAEAAEAERDRLREELAYQIKSNNVPRDVDAARICDLEDDLASLRAQLQRAREALIQIEQHANMSRVWSGMDWTYHGAPSFRVEQIAAYARAALAQETDRGE